jgi:hypothetical protein
MGVAAERLQALQSVRAQLDKQFPNATPVPRRTSDGVATGIAALDAILPNGGFPKGRLSVWTPNGGATAALRAACTATVGRSERAVWVDGAGTIAGAFWRVGPVLVRPRGRVEALRAAEVLARSGGFALVVVTGVEPEGTENVRLSRAAHDGGTAVIALTHSGSTAGLKITSRLAADEYVWARGPHGEPALVTSVGMHVRVSALGWNRRMRIALPVQHDVARCALDPMMPDRRGATVKYVFPGAAEPFVVAVSDERPVRAVEARMVSHEESTCREQTGTGGVRRDLVLLRV